MMDPATWALRVRQSHIDGKGQGALLDERLAGLRAEFECLLVTDDPAVPGSPAGQRSPAPGGATAPQAPISRPGPSDGGQPTHPGPVAGGQSDVPSAATPSP